MVSVAAGCALVMRRGAAMCLESCGRSRWRLGAQLREARPGFVELVELVEVYRPPDRVRAELRHHDGGDVERPCRLVPDPPRDGARPALIEREGGMDAQPGGGPGGHGR